MDNVAGSFSPVETPKIIGKYKIEELIAEGNWGKVRMAIDMETGEKVAIKVFHRQRLERKIKDGVGRLYSEYNLVRKLEHPNVIKYREIFESGTKLYLVMELGGVGLDVLRDSSTGDFDETILKHMMRQLFDCLVYLQSQSISHHDIKASNLLYSSDGRLLLCDFGVAEEAGADGLCRCFYGTPTFQAPEIAGNVDGHPYDGYKADVWSAGILFFYMITGGYPYTAETVYLLLKAIEEDPVKLPNNLDPVLEDLLSRLLDKDPVTRISASEALQHPWFSQDQQVWESCCTLSKCSIS